MESQYPPDERVYENNIVDGMDVSVYAHSNDLH